MLRNNRLLWGLTAFVAGYWILGIFFVPGTQITALASLALLFGGLMTLSQYAPVAYRIVFEKLRNDQIPEGYGAHIAVLSTTLLAAGAVWSGFATAAWVHSGQPQAWLDGPMMGFGRYLMAGGFFGAHVSPLMTRDGVSVTRAWVMWAAAFAILVFGIFVGALMARPDLVMVHASCAPTQPIKGNVSRRGHLYHEPGSPSYAITIPEGCYATAGEAVMAGYRKAY